MVLRSDTTAATSYTKTNLHTIIALKPVGVHHKHIPFVSFVIAARMTHASDTLLRNRSQEILPNPAVTEYEMWVFFFYVKSIFHLNKLNI